MKKILKIIILIIALSITNVKADYFYEDNYISDIYVTYDNGTIYKPQHMRVIKNKSDNTPLYCIKPSERLYYDELYNNSNSIAIPDSKLKRIKQIAYFGYNYKDHTDLKWYAITQVMLWKEIDSTAKVYYTDTFKGKEIDRFNAEEKEINDLIDNYNKIPNIPLNDIIIKRRYSLTDFNYVLNDFDMIADPTLNAKIEDNKLQLFPSKVGDYKIKFIKKDGNYSNNTTFYKAKRGQDLMLKGSIDKVIYELNFTVKSGSLTIKKIDSETLNSDNRGSAKVDGAVYNLYDTSDNFIDTFIIDNDGLSYKENLSYNTYKLVEVKAPIGYLIDETIHDVYIHSSNTYIELKENIIRANLIIKKYTYDTIKKIEKGISFDIYDENNKLVDTLTTNEEGIASINLIYGKYKIVQKNTTLGYKKVDDFYINIDSIEEKNIELVDEKIKTTLTINKKDVDNNKLIEDSAYFKIKDLNKNKYITINNESVFKTINGVLKLDILGGKYLLEEVKTPNGYIKIKDIEFIIDEDNTNLNIDVFNKKQAGIIKINKVGILFNKTKIPLDNVIFKIYAREDIVDYEKIIKKDELVDTIISINGIAISKKLPFGKYYIKEIKTNNNFILDNKIYYIDLNDKKDEIITKTIEILNYEKKSYKNNIYPKTNNTEIYIKSLICYLLFFGLILLISNFKHEK